MQIITIRLHQTGKVKPMYEHQRTNQIRTARRAIGLFHPRGRRYAGRRLYERLSAHPAREIKGVPGIARQISHFTRRTPATIEDGVKNAAAFCRSIFEPRFFPNELAGVGVFKILSMIGCTAGIHFQLR